MRGVMRDVVGDAAVVDVVAVVVVIVGAGAASISVFTVVVVAIAVSIMVISSEFGNFLTWSSGGKILLLLSSPMQPILSSVDRRCSSTHVRILLRCSSVRLALHRGMLHCLQQNGVKR